MRVVSWNMARRAAGWAYLDARGFDIALLQEVPPAPADFARDDLLFTLAPGLTWGTAIVTRWPGLAAADPAVPEAWAGDVRAGRGEMPVASGEVLTRPGREVLRARG